MGVRAAQNPSIVNKEGGFHSIAREHGYGHVLLNDTGAIPAPGDPDWLAPMLASLAGTHQVPGAQLAVHRSGMTVAVEIGELEHGSGVPVTRETAFPVGSISKVLTATLAMILVADGDLELDAPLDEYLPELDDLGSQLTLRQLLSHTSGFADIPEQQSTLSLRRYVREHCRRHDLVVPPQTGFSYSSRNYVLVGHLIETITGMSWWEAMESILLRPLGVDPAAVVGSTRGPSGRPIATGHSVNLTVGRTRPVQQSFTSAEAPAGALAMSAVDLVALGLMHIGAGFPELLPASYAEQMRQAVPEAHPFGLSDGWGLGLAVFRGTTTDWVGHDGNANGTSCYLRIDPVGGWVVALTTNANSGSYLWEDLRIELSRANLLPGAHQGDLSSRAPVASPAEFVGSYSNGPREYLVTIADDGALCLASGDELVRLAFYDDLDFLIKDPISGRIQYVGRFLRDPITKQVEHVQIGGRLASRRLLAVPEPRSSADSMSFL